MFGIGLTEIIIILVVALLVVGPKKLPELAKTLGRSMAAFRKTAEDFNDSIYKDKDSFVNDEKKSEEPQINVKDQPLDDSPVSMSGSLGEGSGAENSLAENKGEKERTESES